jgi:Skp family chaperone for outer membrane proteins
LFNIYFQAGNVEQQPSQFVLSNSPARSESDNIFDIDETDNFLRQQENLRKEEEENKKKLTRMTQSLVLGSAESEAQVDEEIRRLQEEFNESYSELSRNLSKSVPDSLLFSGQSSPINA